MADLTYQNFDLRIERGRAAPGEAPGYRAAVLASPVGEASTDFTLTIPQDAPIEAIGRLLFEAAFSGEALTALRRSLDRVGRRRGGLRIRLRLSEAPELADLPWEALYDPRRERFLALSTETPIVRYLDLPEAIEPLKTAPPLRILPVMASPRDLPRLDLAGEIAALRRALADLADAGLIEIEPQPPTTPADLRDALRRRAYHVIHFLGHGDIDPDTGEGFLVMEDRDGNGRPVTGAALAALLGDHRSLRLVVLNACRAAAAAAGRPFTGVAGRLVQRTIPAVIAMRTAISDEAAAAFAHEFYAALADGYAVDAAVTEARKALLTEGQMNEWATPVLFLRAADGRIFDLPPRKDDAVVQAGDRITEEVKRELIATSAAGEDACAAFISYAAADRQWVFDTLLPQIEQAGHRAIVDVRDFPPGPMPLPGPSPTAATRSP
ncbi:MAG: CHAT domain-containing protein, partial [Anaerolineae bacterium]